MASYKGVDIAGGQCLFSSLRTAIETSTADEALAILSNEQILKSNNNAYFLKLLENIQNKIYSLQATLTEKNVRKMTAIIFGLIFVFASLPFSICLVLDESSYLFWALLKITPFIFEGIIPFTFVGNPITFAKNLRKLKEKIITTKEKLKIK